MIVIKSRHYPFDPYYAKNIWGIVICRIDKGEPSKTALNHEYIHTKQLVEMFLLLHYVWYYTEWIIRYFGCHDKMKAYRAISFEREAYDNQRNLEYTKLREPYAWMKYYDSGSFPYEIAEFLRTLFTFVRDDFRWRKYLFALFAVITILVLQCHFHFYNLAIAPSYGDGTSVFRVPLIYIAAYFLFLVPTLYFHDELWRLRRWQVWVLPCILLFIHGAGQGFNWYDRWMHDAQITERDFAYLHLTFSFLFRSVIIVASLSVFRWITTGKFGLYGVHRSSSLIRVYLVMYLVLVPVFVLVSFTPQLMSYYPRMNIEHFGGALGLSDWQLICPFELSYANDFLATESMFRGALVIGLARWLGPRTVLPMCLTYMCIHLGKPDLELCSSVFGGYILGILAYRTKHLWGGIIVHLGVAMLFEMLGLCRQFL